MSIDNHNESNDIIENKQRQAFRDSRPELRSYERQLRNQYVNNQQACQIIEKQYRQLRDQISQKREAEYLNMKVKQEENQHQENALKLQEGKIDYSVDLQNQIKEREQRQRSERSDVLDEKKRMDELIKKYHEDRERLLLNKKKTAELSRCEMETRQQMKDISVKKEKLLTLEELKKIEQAKAEQERRKLMLLEEIRLKRLKKEEIQAFLSANIRAQEMAIRERADLISELQEFEKDLNRDESADGMRRRRGSISSILKTQIQANIAREKNLKETEKLYREQLKQNIRHEDQQDYSRRLIEEVENIHYSIDLQNQIAENIQKKISETETMHETDNLIKQYNDQIEQKIAREKAELLKEYFPQ